MPRDPLVGAMETLRTSLCRGEYDALPALAQRIEVLMLNMPRPDAARLRRLRHQADATCGCLSAAQSGLRAARRRIEEVAAGASALGTYDRAGTRAPLSTDPAAARRL